MTRTVLIAEKFQNGAGLSGYVAELAAAMVCARLGIRSQFEQNAAYLEHWVKVMREDSRAIVRAASMAQAAADWMFDTAGEPGAAAELREAA